MSGIRRRPVQQRSKVMVEFLLEAAARVFDREGIDATTNRIAEQAGVSIGSLYQYFDDKQGLLHELALRHLHEVERTFEQAARTPATSAHEMIERMVHAAVDLHRQRGGLHRMMREHAPRSPELVDRFAEVLERITDMVEKALAKLQVRDPKTRARVVSPTLTGTGWMQTGHGRPMATSTISSSRTSPQKAPSRGDAPGVRRSPCQPRR
jgi:AcrR family transcriptional regulator